VSTVCTATARCTLVGGRGAVLDGGGPTGDYGLHLVGASYWTVSGLTVDNAAKGVVLDGSSHDTLSGLDVHGIGQEGIHLRADSSDNTVSGSLVHDTGLSSPAYGEGVYVGSAKSNWATYTAGLPDTSDRNVITGNQISRTGAESVDIKEGTTGGTLSDNTFDGTGMSGQNYADSWVDVKGNGWLIAGNRGTHALTDGFQTHVAVTGWGQDNVFRSNVADTRSAGYGFALEKASTVHNTVACSNTAPSAAAGLANVTCTP
jgi:parallel beta-helix repeat protein